MVVELWIAFVCLLGLVALLLLYREHRRAMRRLRLRKVASDILFENWRIADERYFACMRKVLEAQRTDSPAYDNLLVDADRLWRAALAAERSAKRAR